jgi:predicted house-cleaning noncanonical NTP pyrophosphatase (MazG superfamily)
VINKIYYYKLVRDKIPDIIKKSGGLAKFRKLTSGQFEKELLKKVGEESSALPRVKSKKELIDELADVVEVISEIKKFKKITEKQIKAARKTNMDKKGGFKKKLYLVWSEDTGYRTNERKYSKNQ